MLVLHVQPPITASVDAITLTRIADATDGARNAGVPVMYAKLGFRPGYSELAKDAAESFRPTKPLVVRTSNDIHEAVAPLPDHLVVNATPASVFAASNLDIVLRRVGINHLVPAGIRTSETLFGLCTTPLIGDST